MKKLLISGIAAIALTSGAMAGEAVKLTPSQMDQVAAGACNAAFLALAACAQNNATGQTAVGVGAGGCNGALNCNFGGLSGNGAGVGANFNATAQTIAF